MYIKKKNRGFASLGGGIRGCEQELGVIFYP